MEAECARFDLPLRAAAARFPLAHPAVVSVLIGARSPYEITDALDLRRRDIPARLQTELDRT
jgi:D-threo-aldose 1-dehydrogenase